MKPDMNDTLSIRQLSDALVAEFCAALKGAAGEAVVVPSSAPALGPGWRLHLTASGRMRGDLVAWIDISGGEMLAQRVKGSLDPTTQEAVGVLLRDVLTDAARALPNKDPFGGITLSAGPIEPGEAVADAIVYELRAGEAVVWMAIGGEAVPVTDNTAAQAVASAQAGKLDVVLDLDLPLVVRFGRTQMTLRALSQIGPGSIIDMERSPDEPVQMLIGDQVIAVGEVVVVAGHYGVRVIDLVSAADRVRALEA
jgi:flagellar motor switch protein FliN/FliY